MSADGALGIGIVIADVGWGAPVEEGEVWFFLPLVRVLVLDIADEAGVGHGDGGGRIFDSGELGFGDIAPGGKFDVVHGDAEAIAHGGAGDDVGALEGGAEEVDPPCDRVFNQSGGGRFNEQVERDDIVSIVIGVEGVAEAHLADVIETFGGARLFFGTGERRQEHAGEQGDDGDDDQQLDESETGAATLGVSRSVGHLGAVVVMVRSSR